MTHYGATRYHDSRRLVERGTTAKEMRQELLYEALAGAPIPSDPGADAEFDKLVDAVADRLAERLAEAPDEAEPFFTAVNTAQAERKAAFVSALTRRS